MNKRITRGQKQYSDEGLHIEGDIKREISVPHQSPLEAAIYLHFLPSVQAQGWGKKGPYWGTSHQDLVRSSTLGSHSL